MVTSAVKNCLSMLFVQSVLFMVKWFYICNFLQRYEKTVQSGGQEQKQRHRPIRARRFFRKRRHTDWGRNEVQVVHSATLILSPLKVYLNSSFSFVHLSKIAFSVELINSKISKLQFVIILFM